MTEEEKDRDYIKEEQKGLFEYVRMYTLLIIALSASASSIFLREDFAIKDSVVMFFVLNIVTLIVAFLFFVKTLIKIDNNYFKLKNL